VAVAATAEGTATRCAPSRESSRVAVLDGLEVVDYRGTSVVVASMTSGAIFEFDGRSRRWMRLPTGGVNGLQLIAARSPGTLFAAPLKGLYRTSEVGGRWKPLLCSVEVNVMQVTGKLGEKLYVGARQNLVTGEGGGIYVTQDGGISWRRTVNLPSNNLNVDALLVSVHTTRTLYASTEAGGLLETRDAGRHWEWITVAPPRPGIPHGAPLNSLAYGLGMGDTRVMWAGTRLNGAFLGNADGGKWRPRGLAGRNVQTIIGDPVLPNAAYASASSTPGRVINDGTFVTRDGGLRWRRISALPAAMQLTLDSNSDTLYAWLGHLVYRSADHGVTWTLLPRVP
jgi:hypothetical protein